MLVVSVFPMWIFIDTEILRENYVGVRLPFQIALLSSVRSIELTAQCSVEQLSSILTVSKNKSQWCGICQTQKMTTKPWWCFSFGETEEQGKLELFATFQCTRT